MKTKLLAILMAVTMVFAMAPLTAGFVFADDENADVTEVEMTAPDAFDVEATEPEVVEEDAADVTKDEVAPRGVTKYNVWVKGKQVTSKNKSGKGWKYTEKNGSGILTLKKAKFSGSYSKAAIYAEGVYLEIKLVGKNTITNKRGGCPAIQITKDSDNNGGVLAFVGSGSLNVKSSGYAIAAPLLYMGSTTVKAQSTSNTAIYTEISDNAPSIYIYNSKVDAIGGGAAPAFSAGDGIWIDDSIISAKSPKGIGIWSMTDIQLNGTKMTVNSGGPGLFSTNGGITITNDYAKYPAYLDVTSGNSIMARTGINLPGLKILEPEDGYVSDSGGMHFVYTAEGEMAKHIIISKYANTLAVKGKTTTVKYKKLKKADQIVEPENAYTVTDPGQGDLTFSKSSGNKKIKVGEDGTITVKKGLKKGKFKVKVKVRAAGDDDHNFVTKTATVTIRVK